MTKPGVYKVHLRVRGRRETERDGGEGDCGRERMKDNRIERGRQTQGYRDRVGEREWERENGVAGSERLSYGLDWVGLVRSNNLHDNFPRFTN